MTAVIHMTQRRDADDNDFTSFSASSRCPSMSSSFLTIDTSPLGPGAHRRQSIASSATSSSADFFSTTADGTASPSTPWSSEYINMGTNGDSMACLHVDFEMQGTYTGWKSEEQDVDPMWLSSEMNSHGSLPFLDCSGMDTMDVQGLFSGPNNSKTWHILPSSAVNPSFSRDIFGDHQPPSDDFTSGSVPQWTLPTVQTPPQTVAPSATFHPILASSPCKLEPMTPQRYPAPATFILSSSPCQLYSSNQLTSQQDYEMAEQLLEAMPVTPKHAPKPRRTGGRSTRPSYERKCSGSAGGLKSAVSKSGMGCDVVIKTNKYPCGYVDCVDKNGKRKMFQRREHAKRHLDTVHLKKKKFGCWVPGCTKLGFTRSDNLTSHYKKTHGKKSVSSRNRYVSTLDPASDYFDPEYRGDLDDNGRPVDERGNVLKPLRTRI